LSSTVCTGLWKREIPFHAGNKAPAFPVVQPPTLSTEGSQAREQEVTHRELKKNRITKRYTKNDRRDEEKHIIKENKSTNRKVDVTEIKGRQ
jgi:hypothetical protein